MAHTNHRGMGVMAISEGLLDKDLAEARQFPGKPLVVLFLLRVESQVLKEYYVSRVHLIYQLLYLGADAVFCQGYFLTQQPGESLSHRVEAEAGDCLPFGSTKMGGKDDPGLLIKEEVYRR